MSDYKFPVEAGHIMMFARAIGDSNPLYHDPEYAAASEFGGVIAPPTYVWSSVQYDPDYPLRPKIGEPWFGSGTKSLSVEPDSTNDGGGVLHAEQHFEYHRGVLAGDVLTVSARPGKTWEKESKRSGKLVFIETITEFRNQNGELAVTARTVAVKPERPAV